MLHLIPLLATLAAGDSTAPLAVRATTEAGTSLVVHAQPAVPLVTLRVALRADDPPGYAGAGHLVQHLVLPALRSAVARVGGRAEAERTADAVAYTVTGPARELPALAAMLRAALEPAEPAEGDLYRAGRELLEERLAEWENAGQHVRSALRLQLFPAEFSAAGTAASAERLASVSSVELWRAMYRPERVLVTAVGDVTLPRVEEALGSLPPARIANLPEAEDTLTFRPLAPAEATRGWLGLGVDATGEDPATVTVLARLLRDALRKQAPGAEVEAEHWWTHRGQAIVVVASAPAPLLAPTRQALGGLLASLAGGLTGSEVADAARAVRRETLLHTRTSERMATVLGRFAEREGDPDAADAYYAALDATDPQRVRDLLGRLRERAPARAEIAPQKPAPPARRR